MATYENGDGTKAQIIAACEKLFLAKGYSETTFLDICKEAHVNQGSIYYHFREKTELFRQVAWKINEEHRSLAQKVLPPDAPAYMKFLVDIYVYWYRIFHDETYRRFMATPGPSVSSELEQYMGYWQNCRAFIPDFDGFLSENALNIIACAGIDRQLTLYVAGNIQKHSWQEIAEYHVRAIALLFRYSPEAIDRTVEKLRSLVDSMNFSVLFEKDGI